MNLEEQVQVGFLAIVGAVAGVVFPAMGLTEWLIPVGLFFAGSAAGSLLVLANRKPPSRGTSR